MTPIQLAKIHAAAFTKQRPWSEMEFATLIQNKLVFIIANSHCFALGRTVADEVELLTLATDPEKRRHGHAQDCLDRFHQEARARQASTSILEVALDNQAACRLYQNNHYNIVAERPNYYGRPNGQCVTALVMSRAL